MVVRYLGSDNKSTSDVIQASSSRNSGAISITTVNKQLRDAVKKKEKFELPALLEQISPTGIRSLDTKALAEYIEKVIVKEPEEVKAIFNSQNLSNALANGTLGSNNPKIAGLVSSLLAFVANPTQAVFNKNLAEHFTTKEHGLSLFSDAWTSFRTSSKLDPLAKAAIALGLPQMIPGAKNSIKNIEETPETRALGEAAKKSELVRLEKSMKTVFDSSGNITNSKGDVMQKAIDIQPEDIEKVFGASYKDNPPVPVGKLKWNDFARTAWELALKPDSHELTEYVNSVLAMYNHKMRAERELAIEAGTVDGAKLAKQLDTANQYVIELFSSESSRLPDGLLKAFQKAFSKGAFVSDATVQAIAGEASTKAAKAAIETQIKDAVETASKVAELSAQSSMSAIASEGDTDKIKILDLTGIVTQDVKGAVDLNLDYDSGKKTFALGAQAYRASSTEIASEVAKTLSTSMFEGPTANIDARKKYLDTKTVDENIELDVKAISEVAKGLTKTAEASTIDGLAQALSLSLGHIRGFSVDLSDNNKRDELKKQITSKFMAVTTFATDTSKESNYFRSEVDRQVDNLITNIIEKGNTAESLRSILELVCKKDKNTATETKDAQPDVIKSRLSRLKGEFEKESNVQAFIRQFIAGDDAKDILANVNLEGIESLVRDNRTLNTALMRSCRGANIDSIDDLLQNNKHLEAGSTATLIFANSDDIKNDGDKNRANLLGFIGLCKEANVSSNQTTLEAIVKRLFSREIDEVSSEHGKESKVQDLVAKFRKFLDTGVTIANLPKSGDVEVNGLDDLSKIAGASLVRASYLDMFHRDVTYAKESIVANRLSSMINAHVSPEGRKGVHGSIVTVLDALKSAREGVDGKSVGDVEGSIKGALGGDANATSIVNSMFGVTKLNTIADAVNKFTPSTVVQLLEEWIARLGMILPRLYGSTDEQSARPIVKQESSSANSAEKALQTAA